MMSKRKEAKVPVSMRAVIQRINRKLKADDEVLKTARGEGRLLQDVGRYYVVNIRINGLVGRDVDPTEMARKLGVLKDYERVIEDVS